MNAALHMSAVDIIGSETGLAMSKAKVYLDSKCYIRENDFGVQIMPGTVGEVRADVYLNSKYDLVRSQSFAKRAISLVNTHSSTMLHLTPFKTRFASLSAA